MTEHGDDPRIVMTLDAGGTNFRFSAIHANRPVTEVVAMPSEGDNLDRCLAHIVEGFTRIKEQCPTPPVAISFAFPGPADYPNGIIGDLGNLPSFRGGIALGLMLEGRFGIPVFINNDGDLFTYGEALAGFLPYVNDLLDKAGSPKRYKNLLGITLGTGLGGGVSGAWPLFLPVIVDELNGTYTGSQGRPFRRLASVAFNLEDPADLERFLRGQIREITVPGSGRRVRYDPLQRIGVGLSRLGTSEAVAIGAYAFALRNIGRSRNH